MTGEIGTPTDFLAFHAKGRPTFVDGHVRMGISTHLKEVDNGFQKIAAVTALAAKPIVIGESDPEGCAACPGPQNAYRNGTMYSSYTAASFARIWELAQKRRVNLEGVLTWAFEFEDQPWFAGYRQLSTNGVNLPVLNVFRMFAKLGPRAHRRHERRADTARRRSWPRACAASPTWARWQRELRMAALRYCSGTITTMMCRDRTPPCG